MICLIISAATNTSISLVVKPKRAPARNAFGPNYEHIFAINAAKNKFITTNNVASAKPATL